MTTRRPFQRVGEETRRSALIEATLDLIAEGGPQAATVRAIATRAGVTPGLIRHYFATKEELVAAAHETLMTGLTEASMGNVDDLPDDPLARLAAFIGNAVSPPVTDTRAVALWAASMQLVPRDAAMRAVHLSTYLGFRDRLETMLSDALRSAGRDTEDTRSLAIACNALLDGLWVEAGALPDQFASGELRSIAIKAFSRLLSLDLPEV
ncbi:TetR/AcrR family transcriptional regulator [Rhodobacter sp. NTK016B]|uniref:TetR/AcrR family transcriptional regulator n=1 Tax=Rhodobacter sp. NTK016B TaxID=2759676 RepID=UPI001A8FDDD9|nr:TetR/AcrR family transcriptional regulator [Rhodobacter sp. NTK016B]MBN8291531.1 TetR/AcrR family transcriptional regulator [Rhodobacter sp. NTK016B]